MKSLLLAGLLALGLSPAVAGTMYIDTAANGSASAIYSGSTDTTSPTVNSASATITCSATTYTGATPGCSLSGSPNLSAVVTTPGATQDSIYLACATNTNQKIFWITAVDDTLDLVQTTGTPTGCTAATSSWAIGGRAILTNASQEATIRAGDTVIFNISPASQSAALWTFRNAGDTTTGYATLRGKTGVRPTLTATSTNTAINMAVALAWVENLEIVQQGATNAGIVANGGGDTIYNVKITDSGSGGGVNVTASGVRVINSEISGSAGDGVATNSNQTLVQGNYIHDNTGDGFEATQTGPSVQLINNIIDTNTARGIYFSGATTIATVFAGVYGNTIYGNLNSGLEVADADSMVILSNNIFVDNGDAANEYNVEWAAGSADYNSVHVYNDFWCTGLAANVCTAGSGNVSGLTVGATEIITNPALAAASTGNFTIATTSPAYATGFPGVLLGTTSTTGYMSMGPVQVQGAAAGTGGTHGLIIGGP